MDPLSFNIILCDLPLSTESNYSTNYADDTTPYVIGNDPGEALSELRTIAEKLFTPFAQNEMKGNLDKCEAINFQISEILTHKSYSRKLLGVAFDNKLKFEKHITTICQKAYRKLNHLTFYMDFQKRQILMNAFFNSQFNYCPVIWMLFRAALINKINRLHESCLRVVDNDKRLLLMNT